MLGSVLGSPDVGKLPCGVRALQVKRVSRVGKLGNLRRTWHSCFHLDMNVWGSSTVNKAT